MATLRVESLTFTFQRSVDCWKYDESRYHFEVHQQLGKKAVDVVAMKMGNVPKCVWLIEAKDFRVVSRPPEPANLKDLADTVFEKVTDTLSGLSAAAAEASDPADKVYAARAVAGEQTRIVLHVEPHTGRHTKLFPTNFATGVLQKLRQLAREIDPQPLVLSIASTTRAGVPWAVS